MIELHHGDCLDVMRRLPDSSISAIVTDPPYFKVKGETWDRQWDKPEGYLEWFGRNVEEWYRLLKPNGSLYCFAGWKMASRIELAIGERFNVLNHVVWVKGDGWHHRQSKEELRTFFPQTERIIFAEHKGADNIAKGEAGYAAKCDELRGFVFEPLRAYLDGERQRAGVSVAEVDRRLYPIKARRYFRVWAEGWNLLTEGTYTKLQQAFPGYFRREYEDLRREYEDLRRPFSVSRDVPFTDVWTFPTVAAYPGKHPCEKPLDMMRHILKTSVRPGGVVLDPFMGSGTTGVACHLEGMRFIGIEQSVEYVEIARQRIESAGKVESQQATLFEDCP